MKQILIEVRFFNWFYRIKCVIQTHKHKNSLINSYSVNYYARGL